MTSALSEPLLGALDAFRSARPRVELRLSEVDTGWGQQALLRHEIDIAVIRPSTPVRGLRIRPWRHDELVLALPPHHPLAADAPRPVGLARFADEPWVWLSREASPDYHDQLTATCRRAGFSPDVRHLANSILTQLAMVTAGLGVPWPPTSPSARAQPSPTARSPNVPTSSNFPSSPGKQPQNHWSDTSCRSRRTRPSRTRAAGIGRLDRSVAAPCRAARRQRRSALASRWKSSSAGLCGLGRWR